MTTTKTLDRNRSAWRTWNLDRAEPMPSSQVNATLADYQATGCTAFRNAVVQSHLRLVASIAHRYSTPNVTTDELMSEGVLALLAAADSFDPGRGLAFTTYAWPIIEGRIRAAMGSADQVIARPHRKSASAIPLRRVDTPLEVEAASAGAGLPSEAVENKEMAKRVREAMAHLPRRQSRALGLRFGMVDGQPKSCRQIAERLGLTVHQAQAALDRGLRTLRARMQDEHMHRPTV